MTDALNVARYIIKNYYKYHKNDLDSVKLEELVYYSQAWTLSFTNEPLFRNRIQAGINGPICPDLYKVCNRHNEVSKNSLLDKSNYNQNVFTNSQKIIMDNVIRYYGNHSSWYLVLLSCKELPWLLTKDGIPRDKPCKKTISMNVMRNYYKSMIV